MKSMNVLRVRASVKDGRNKEWLVRSCGFILDSNQKETWFNSPVEILTNSRNRSRATVQHSAALHVATPFEIHGTVKAGLTRQSKRELLRSGKNRLWVHWEWEEDVQKWAGEQGREVTVILGSRCSWVRFALRINNSHPFSAQSLFLRLCANYWSFI